MKTQKSTILEYLEKHKTITTLESVLKLGITDPQHYIMELRKEGYIITSRWVLTTNRYGRKIKYKEYRLINEKHRLNIIKQANKLAKQWLELVKNKEM